MTCTIKNINFSVSQRNRNVCLEMKSNLIQFQTHFCAQLYGRHDSPSIAVDTLECQYYINSKNIRSLVIQGKCLFGTNDLMVSIPSKATCDNSTGQPVTL
jgi:hypothetical protein